MFWCKVQQLQCSDDYLLFYNENDWNFAIIDFKGKNMLRYSGSFVPTKDMINAIKYCERCLKV